MQIEHFLMRNRHGSVWYARVYIPRHLHHLFNGRKEFRKSTRYTERRQAARVALRYWAECQYLFEEIEQDVARKKKKKKPATLQIDYAGITDLFGRKHEFDFGGETDPEAAEREQKAVDKVKSNDMAYLEKYQDNPELLMTVLGSRQPVQQVAPNVPETVMTWEALFDSYVERERQRIDNPTDSFSEATFKTYAPHRALWKDYFSGREVHSIKRSEIREIELWLQRLPTGYTKRKLSSPEAIDLAKQGDHGYKCVSAVSFNNYQRQITGLLRFAAKEGAHDQDLAFLIEQMNAKRGREKDKLTFDDAEMTAIFNAEYLENLGKGSRRATVEARFWVPLIAALSGARLDEICQLKVSDIRYDESADCHYMHIASGRELASDGKAKKIKTANSVRPIPLHPVLLKIGFMEYVESMQEGGGEVNLFKLERGTDNKFGGSLSKWFSRKGKSPGFIEQCGIDSGGVYADGLKWSKSFHSFRHTVIDNLRDEDKRLPDGTRMTEADRALAVGHLDKKESRLETRHYGEGVTNMKLRRDIINLISYPGVNFDSIKWPN